MEKESKNFRKQVYDLSLYSSGSFKVSEMFNMPISMLMEIRESLEQKYEKEKEAINKSKGITTRTF
jgi:hypothetical protein